jgi:formylmethanofuran dehydrogenase subunit E-like metal-binding protein
MMSLISEINDFFIRYGEQFDLKTINYTKQVVHKIKTSPVLKTFLSENKITASLLLNEITPYSQFKLKQYGDEKLDMREIQSVLNIILFSNELEYLMIEDHVVFSSIGPLGEIFYRADEYASDYFNEKYGLDIVEDEEFDFTVLEDRNGGTSDYNIGGFGIN